MASRWWKDLLLRSLPESIIVRLQAADHYLNGEPEIRLLPHLCDKAKVTLDIGANIGSYTYFARRYSRQVYAYEANPELAARLERLFPDVTVRHAAVSDQPGELVLRIPVKGEHVQHELASVAEQQGASEETVEYRVPAHRVDDEKLTNVGFIKIDVERHELPVMKGAMKTIVACLPVIMSEVSPLLYPGTLPEMFAFLTELGYTGWFKFEGDYYPLSKFRGEIHANPDLYGKRFMNNNVIFLPAGFDDSFLRLP